MKTFVLNFRKILSILILFLATGLYSQINVNVKGKITDAQDNPLIGANISIVGTTLGTISDIDGNYNLTASLKEGNYIMVFSYVGYQDTKESFIVSTSEKNFMLNVVLNEDALKLDEVVVTGNSPTAKRKQLGNSIGVVSGSDIGEAGTPNVVGALAGKVMGAQITQNSGDPAGGFSVRLRGASTIIGSSDPLYIIDGVIVDNSSTNVINLSADAMSTGFQAGQNRLVDINPNDVERIEVLNGASAAAIYGSRAANGVVQIFTKRGKSDKPVIEYSSSFNYSQLRKKVFFTQHPERFGVPGNDRLETTQDRLTILLTLGLSEAALTANNVGFVKAGSANRLLVTDTYPVQRYDYQEEIFGPAFGTDQFLSMRGGTDKTKYYGSLGFNTNEGIIRNTSFTKYSGRLRLDQSVNDWMSASVGLSYTQSNSNDLPNGNNFFSPISTMFIIDNVWDITERDAAGNLKQVELVRVNPLSVIETFKLSQRTNRTIGDIQLKFFPTKGLRAEFIVGVDNYSLTGNEFRPRFPYSGVAASFFDDGYVSAANSTVSLINNDFVVTYEKELTDNIVSTTTAGYQIQYNKTQFQAQEGRGLAPFVETLAGASNFFTAPQQIQTERLVSGYFLQETFGYKDKLFLTLAGRIDASSAFSAENQTNFYPKASISYILNEDIGLTGSGFLNSLKLRSSFGQAGNLTGIGPYDRYNNYLLSVFGGQTSIIPSAQLANPDVKPERMTEIEFGGDLAFSKNRGTFSFTVYQQDIADLLLFRPLSPSSGGTTIVSNLDGAMKNRGLELMLNYNFVNKKDFSWGAGINYTMNRNEVQGVDGILALRGSDGPQHALNGEQYGVFFGRYYARNNDGTLLLTSQNLAQTERGFVIPSDSYDPSQMPSEALVDRAYTAGGSVFVPARAENGQPLTSTVQNANGTSFTPQELRKKLGDPNPGFIATLTSDVRYKKLKFGLQLDGFFGADIYNWNRITSNNVGFGPLAEQELKGEVPRGYVGSIAGGVTGSRIMEDHVEDATFVKLREISLSYDLGSLGKAFNNFNIGIAGRNLFSIDNYSGFDPETNSAGQTDRVRGDDFGNVPIPMSVQVRINAKF